jgi:hypothetical protein
MKKVLIVLLVAVQLSASGQFPGLAKTPPMGWNSWNAFGLNINLKIVMSVAGAMVATQLLPIELLEYNKYRKSESYLY